MHLLLKSLYFCSMSLEELQKENERLEQENGKLRFELEKLKKLIFGRRTERFEDDFPAEQLRLDFSGKTKPNEDHSPQQDQEQDNNTEQQDDEETTIKIEYERRKKRKTKKGREALPAHLPRVDVVIEPKMDVSGMTKIGQEITEILDYMPAILRVIRVIRPKYINPFADLSDMKNVEELPSLPPCVTQASPEDLQIATQTQQDSTQLQVADDHNEPNLKTFPAIIIAELPSRVIDKGIPSESLLSHICISKFIDHLPYYRQINIFDRQGASLARSTVNGWIAKVCVLLKPLYDQFKEYQFRQPYLQCDETTLRVLGIKLKGSHQGYFWVYKDPLGKNAVFIYEHGRGRKYPAEHLKDFSGHLQTDGLKVYNAFDLRDDIILYACMAHIRRKFVEALGHDKQRAEHVLKRIRQLYAIERIARQKQYDHQQRQQLRNEKARPIMDELKAYLDEQTNKVRPQGAIGIAITYARNRWKYMERYLEDGRIEIDNTIG